MAWLGAYDFLAHYARGGNEAVFPEPRADSVVGPQFEQALQGMVTANPTWKGVVGTVPDVLAAPFAVKVEELKAALFNSTEPVPFGVIIILRFAPPPVAHNVGPVVDAPFAIVNSFTALPVAVTFISSFPFASFLDNFGSL